MRRGGGLVLRNHAWSSVEKNTGWGAQLGQIGQPGQLAHLTNSHRIEMKTRKILVDERISE